MTYPLTISLVLVFLSLELILSQSEASVDYWKLIYGFICQGEHRTPFILELAKFRNHWAPGKRNWVKKLGNAISSFLSIPNRRT